MRPAGKIPVHEGMFCGRLREREEKPCNPSAIAESFAARDRWCINTFNSS